jgi:hypothetical protein
MTDSRDRSGSEGRSKLDGILPDAISRAVASGVRSVFATHEGVRKVAETIPKEVVSFIGDQFDGMRGDIFGVFATEFRSFLDRVNVGQEITRVLTALTLQVTMEVRFKPSDNKVGVKPSVKATVKPKRSRRSAKPKVAADEA